MSEDIDKLVASLETMGYFGQIDENLGQRLKNGVNGVLADVFHNNRARGKVEMARWSSAWKKSISVGLEPMVSRHLRAVISTTS